MLMFVHGVDADNAFDDLRQQSRDHNVSSPSSHVGPDFVSWLGLRDRCVDLLR
jgi:hypothetical protein